jgi:hypothetical protein
MWGISITGALINNSLNNNSIDSIYPTKYVQNTVNSQSFNLTA